MSWTYDREDNGGSFREHIVWNFVQNHGNQRKKAHRSEVPQEERKTVCKPKRQNNNREKPHLYPCAQGGGFCFQKYG